MDAEEEAGVEIVLDRAVPNVAAALGPAVTRIACRTPSRSGRRWQAVAGRRRWWAAWRGLGGRGGAGGVLQELFFGPCGHAATSSSSPFIGGAPDPVRRHWLDIPVMRAETCTHSANCADDRRDSPGDALGPVLDMPGFVQRHMHSPRVSRSSTFLSWRRCRFLWS